MNILKTLQAGKTVYYEIRTLELVGDDYLVHMADLAAETDPQWSVSQPTVQEYVVPEESLIGASGAAEVFAATTSWLESSDGPWGEAVAIDEMQYTLELAQQAVRATIKRRRSEMEFSGLNTSFGVVDSDSDSQRRISGAVQMAMLALDQRHIVGDSGPTFADTFFPTGFNLYWRFKDNTILQLTPPQVIEMGVQVGKQVAQIAMVKNLLDAQVNAALDLESLAPVEALALTNWLTIPLA